MKVLEQISIKEKLWYRIGGTVKYFLEVHNQEELLAAVAFINEKGITKVLVIGTGTNLIFTEDYFDGAVICLKGARKSLRLINSTQGEAFAGELLDDLILFAFDHRLVGLEWAGGLPGTVGAAVRGNVGAFGGEIQDCFASADILEMKNGSLQLRTLKKDEMDFSYRSSYVKKHPGSIVVTARFDFTKTNAKGLEKAKEIYFDKINFRKEKHPLEYPNTGSVFKNIKEPDQVAKVLSVFPDLKESVEKKWYGKVAVASLIERLGLKGYRVGDAQISEKHALFIVNLGNATASDVLTIIATVQEQFQQTFGFQLEPEVEIVR